MKDRRIVAERIRSWTCQFWIAALAGALLLGTSAQAQQTSGFGGSFEPAESPPAGQEANQPSQVGSTPPGGSGDGFGGGGVSGSDGFGGGSFVTGGSGDGGPGSVPEAGGGGPGSEGFGGGSFVTGGPGDAGTGTVPEAGGDGAGGPGSEGFGGGAVVGGEAGGGDAGPMAQLIAFELQDFGISPTQTLYQGASHGPTPTRIPGGEVITTADLNGLMQQQQIVLIDVLGGNMTLPGALSAAGLGAPGSFDDQVQAIMVQGLQQVTAGNRQTPVVFFCLSPHCWLSYNAALRAIAAGYGNVLWYRGGVEAWAMAGLELVPAHGN